MFAALPPLAWGIVGWIAPLPWLVLIQAGELPGRRPYRALWLAGFVFWLMAVHWLRLPHPATSLGLLALAAYLALYLPVFVALSRVAVHRIGAPLWLAAPVVWTGLELARAHLLTGFLMGSLAHTQVNWTQLIQISDIFGEYGVDFLVMLVAACLAEGFPIADFALRIGEGVPQSEFRSSKFPLRPLPLAIAGLALIGTLAYGHWRLGEPSALGRDSNPRTIRIALIQGNSLAEWKYDPSRERQIMDEYISLSEQAVELAKTRGDGRPLDVIVWPETMFRTPLITFNSDYKPPANAVRTPEEVASYGPRDLAALVQRLQTPVLVGVERVHFAAARKPDEQIPPPDRYNSAVLVGRDGQIVGTYDKVHRVVFGEFIPFAKWLPFLYRMTPLTGGIEAGSGPVVLELNDRFLGPNICYETVIPHVVRRQANTLVGGSIAADVLINLTNDAWYWGSSELDMHLACGVFRAVEARKPLVIAANGGLSAWIDQLGRVRDVSPRQQPHVILADVEPSHMKSVYLDFGDWLASVCLTICGLLAIVGWRTSNNLSETTRPGDQETRG
jgi:apolipoprotein N-acyltransferase